MSKERNVPDSHLPGSFDVAIVGAGICGLAHALAAARRGKRVVVIDRDAQANGASVRNFGFVTVTGQQRGECWHRAMRSRDVWREVAAAAGIADPASRPARGGAPAGGACRARSVHGDRDGRRMRLLEPGAASHFADARRDFAAVLHSPHELRVEMREAIPKAWRLLAGAHGVTFLRETVVQSVAPAGSKTSRGSVAAGAVIVCPGDDFRALPRAHRRATA